MSGVCQALFTIHLRVSRTSQGISGTSSLEGTKVERYTFLSDGMGRDMAPLTHARRRYGHIVYSFHFSGEDFTSSLFSCPDELASALVVQDVL